MRIWLALPRILIKAIQPRHERMNGDSALGVLPDRRLRLKRNLPNANHTPSHAQPTLKLLIRGTILREIARKMSNLHVLPISLFSVEAIDAIGRKAATVGS